jgi:hypothetical protein
VRRLLWLLLAILTVVMFVLALETDDGTIAGLSRLDFSSLVVKVAVLLSSSARLRSFFFATDFRKRSKRRPSGS